MTDQDSVKALEDQARNTKHLMDRLNRAYLGITTDEIFKVMLWCAETGGRNDNRDIDPGRSGGGA